MHREFRRSARRRARPAGVRPTASPGRVLLFPVLWLSLQLHLLLLGLMSLGWNLVALLLLPLLPRAVGLRIGRRMIAGGYAFFWRVASLTGMMHLHAEALDALRAERGLIVAANHPSLLDALMLVARLPHAACIMKADLVRNPFIGPGARLARYIRNDSPLGMVRLAVADLKRGGQLVLFPEGTRTSTPPLNPVGPGLTLIASRAGVPIQTVFIDTDSPYLSKGWPLWRLPPLPIEFHVRLGRRFAPGGDPAAQRAEIEAYLRAEVRLGPGFASGLEAGGSGR
jgi:1-acyl-sn-glycerol-3-phosphate acyltransferase